MAQIPSNMNMVMNIDFDIFRGRLVFSSNKSSRESFVHSVASSVSYYKRMEIQSDNPLWSKQVKIEEIALLYTTPVKEDSIPVK